MKKIKKLCGIKKDQFDSLKKEIINIVSEPTFICKKCLRVANEKRYLCKGATLK